MRKVERMKKEREREKKRGENNVTTFLCFALYFEIMRNVQEFVKN